MSFGSTEVASADGPVSREQVRDFATLCEYASDLSGTPFEPAPELPSDLKDLDYDDYRLISFWPNEAVWRRDDTPFQLELFHRGYIFFERVRVNLLTHTNDKSTSTSLPFDPTLYEYRGKLYNQLDIPPETGYAGVKMLGTLPSSPHMQEVCSFIGASYFRCLSDGMVYGASSRGLGVNMGMSQPEEFPCFREFWITKPPTDGNANGEFDGPPGSGELHFLAVLDSPSLTGAYEFHLRPGDATAVDVKARLFFRYPVQKLCLAPTSSMWMWGKGRQPDAGDSRPEVHDSDGLLTAQSDGTWTWRSLAKQSYPSVSSQKVTNLTGFGLMQRERNYARYLDDEAKYHARPSLWIEPLDDDGRTTTWPSGWVELFEMPADHEGYDNMAAWFVPESSGGPDEPFDLHYRVTFYAGDVPNEPPARVTDFSVTQDGDLAKVTLTFEGEQLATSPIHETEFTNTTAPSKDETRQTAEPSPPTTGGTTTTALEANVSALRGSIRSVSLAEPSDGRTTLTLTFQPDGSEPVELRASLRRGDRQLTETWSYLCPPLSP